MNRLRLLPLLACITLSLAMAQDVPAPDLTGKWTGSADTIDASGVKRTMQLSLELKGSGKDITAQQMSRQGASIPLKVVVDETGMKFTLLRELEFEGGEHIRFYLEFKDGHLTGTISAVHDAPKKWGVDWRGPLVLSRPI